MRVLGVSVDAGGAASVCVGAVSERLRGVDYVGWQGPVLDVSFWHVAGDYRPDDAAV